MIKGEGNVPSTTSHSSSSKLRIPSPSAPIPLLLVNLASNMPSSSPMCTSSLITCVVTCAPQEFKKECKYCEVMFDKEVTAELGADAETAAPVLIVLVVVVVGRT